MDSSAVVKSWLPKEDRYSMLRVRNVERNGARSITQCSLLHELLFFFFLFFPFLHLHLVRCSWLMTQQANSVQIRPTRTHKSFILVIWWRLQFPQRRCLYFPSDVLSEWQWHICKLLAHSCLLHNPHDHLASQSITIKLSALLLNAREIMKSILKQKSTKSTIHTQKFGYFPQS
jgi:hypothetical protein